MDLVQKTESFGTDDQSWLGSAHGTSSGDPITLTATSAHVTAGLIPSGTLLSEDGTIDPDGTGGTDTKSADGFLLTDIPVTKTGSVQGVILRHGFVIDARRVAKGLTALTAAQKADLTHFVID
jgi:hypothetical protein